VPVSNAYQNAQRLALPSSIPNCGSSVFWEGDRSPTTCGIAVRCFADPDFPVPTSSGWEELMHAGSGCRRARRVSRNLAPKACVDERGAQSIDKLKPNRDMPRQSHR